MGPSWTSTSRSALNLVLPQLKTMLAMQEKASNIQTKIYTLDEELNGMIMAQRHIALTDIGGQIDWGKKIYVDLGGRMVNR